MTEVRRAARPFILSLFAAFALAAVIVAPASAAPSWGIGVAHTNLYGAGGLVSPYSGSGQSFARESGGNAYSIQIVNAALGAGTTLSCETGSWSGSPSFSYQWYRNGAVIAAATSSTYVTTAGDEGMAVQCAITGTNAGGSSVRFSSARQVGGSVAPIGLPRTGEPTISASNGGAVGSVLTCKPEFGWRWPSFGYQWLKNGVPIAGATAPTYTIAGGDLPAAIQCAVNGSNPAGAVTATSGAQNAGSPSPAVPSGPATISGGDSSDAVGTASAVGQTLTCAGGPATATVTFQWLRNGAVIPGATAATYTLAAADQGAQVQCRAVAKNSELAAAAVSNGVLVAPVAPVGPPTAGTPVISGNALLGSTLTCATGAWTGSGLSFSFQWLRNGAEVSGANASTYAVTLADQGANIQCQVTGTSAAGGAAGISASKLFSGQVPTSTSVRSISNLTNPGNPPAVGNELSCGEGVWTQTPTFGYEWLRNGASLGVSTKNYTVAAADEGKVLQCRVTAIGAQASTQGTSNSVVVSPAPGTPPPVLTSAANLTGTPVNVGVELTCPAGTWQNSPTITRRWLRNGVPITGATQEAYRLTLADLNKVVQCEVIATNAGGTMVNIGTTSGSVKYVSPIALVGTASVTPPPTVSVSFALPQGMDLVGEESTQDTTNDDIGFLPATGEPSPRARARIIALGWTCDVTTFTCTRRTALAPGEAYPPIVLHVRPGPLTPDNAGPAVTVYGNDASPPSATAVDPTSIIAKVPFGVTSFAAAANDSSGSVYGVAGGHPFSATTEIKANLTTTSSGALTVAGGDIKELQAHLPPGFSANPQNQPSCPLAIATAQGNVLKCPVNTAVGFVEAAAAEPGRTVTAQGYRYGSKPGVAPVPLYNVEPEPGLPAEFVFREEQNSVPFTLEARLRSDGDYGVTVGSRQVPSSPSVTAVKVTICANGVEEGPLNSQGFVTWKCAPESPTAESFINNPSWCAGGAPLTTLHAGSYQHPDEPVENDAYAGAPPGSYSYFGHRSGASPVASSFLTGCQALTESWVGKGTEPRGPSLEFRPESEAGDSPTGAEVDLSIPQIDRQDALMTPPLKKTVVKLPEGLTLNASAADGLQACSEEQIGLVGTGFPAPNPIHFDGSEPECPNGSKVGTVEAESPLLVERDAEGNVLEEGGKKLDKRLQGSVYLAAQKANPFGTNFALYLAIEEGKNLGITVKLPGKVEADPGTGRLTATFDNNPQLPVEHIRLHFFDGSQSSLATPATCGARVTATQLSPWSAADPDNPTAGETATPSSSFDINTGCAASASQLPFSLGFNAGAKNPVAGAATPFSFRITRPDGAQEISTLSLSPPAGLTAYLAGVAQCSDAQIKDAEGKSGKAEQANPSCPVGSQVGTALVGAGAGSNPYYAGGKLYLAGPYKGAPLSIVAITPAVAGPFDLGDVVVRSAVFVDPRTARITAKTDPLPRILEGVPLRIRDLRVNLDRSHWTVNPTNCSRMTVDATATGSAGATTNMSNSFQVGGCDKLAFKPNLKIQLHGGTKRAAYQRLQTTVTYPKGSGYANIARAAVTLPHSEFLAQEHIRTVCTRVQFAAHACPAGSIYGRATAVTPLLDQPLTGPVYLRSSNNPLPDLVAALRGPDSMPIEVELSGRTDSVHSSLRNTFDVVPDAPVSKFTLELFGGKKSLVVNSRDLCKGPKQRATVRLDAQNGMRRDFRPVVGNDCGKTRKKSSGTKKHGSKKRAARPNLPWWRS